MIYDVLPVNNYSGNGSSNLFDFDFYIENPNQLNVFHFDKNGLKKKLIYNLDYSINEFKNLNGSFITFPIKGSEYDILSSEEKISLELTLPISQETQYNNSSLLNLQALEYSLDYLTRLIQIYSRKFDLCVKVDECSNITPYELMQELNDKATVAQDCANNANNVLNYVNEKYDAVTSIASKINLYNEKFDKIDILDESRAYIDGSNMVESVKNFDGEWVAIGLQLLHNANISTSPLVFDLSSYLPNDNYSYLVSATCNLTGTAGQVSIVWGAENENITATNPWDKATLKLAVGCSVSNQMAFGAGQVIVGADRKIKIASNTGTPKSGFSIQAYRRLGTNQ